MLTRLSRLHPRNAVGAIGAAAVAFLAFGATGQAAAQTTTATSSALQFTCAFVNSPNDCGFYEQAFALPRATVINTLGRDGATSVRLHTEPGDNNVAGSGTAERDDLSLSQALTGCYAGQEQWWAHSILFPDDYVAPPAPTATNWTWGVVFDFHNTTNGPGQANFQINAMSDGLSFQGYAGDPANPVIYKAPIGPTVKNVWYDFVYHVKWSSGSDGFFYAWVNGVQKLAYTGPTLYVNQGCYLKLANYHTPFGMASSVIHDRVVRGSTAAAVTLAPLGKRHAASDFDGDGKSDILWRNGATGQNQMWFMNGGTLTSAASLATVSDLNWAIAQTGDFDGDGKSDILWHNNATGQNQIWFMNGGTLARAASLATISDLNWKIAEVGDFDGDGKSDILWRNGATGQNQIWFMNGATLVSGPLPTADLNWSIAGIGDFDGDGKSDILWRNGATGQNQIWLMNGATLVSGPFLPTMADLNWSIAGIGDFDGSGRSDILWRNGATGQNLIWAMNGATLTALTFLATAPLAWVTAPH